MDTMMAAAARWEQAESAEAYVARTVENHELWKMTFKRAALSEEDARRAAAIAGTWRVLVLAEDWCGDAVNSVPVLQRVADANPNIELRLVDRDQHLDLMDRHLTNGARAIPLAVIHDADFVERGQWGARPAPLQQWVVEHGMQMEKEARYKEVRTWYARDRGRTIAHEFMTALEEAGAVQRAGSNAA